MTAFAELPSYLIPAVRGVFTSQGIPAQAITDTGDINWSLVISSVVTDVELYTTVLPPYRIHLPDALKPAPPSAIARFLKPTLVMSGPRIGRIVTAPYGESKGSWLGPAVAGGLLAGLALHWLTKR